MLPDLPSRPTPTPLKLAFVIGAGVLAVSSAAIFVRYANAAAGGSSAGLSLAFAALRLSFASLILLPAWTGLRGAKVERRVVVFSVIAGLALGVHFAGYIAALGYTSIAASTTLVNTNPIWLALFAWVWLGRRPSRLSFVGIGLALAGGLLIALGAGGTPGERPLLGNLLALVGALGFSVYFLLGSEAQRRGLSTGVYTAIACTVGALSLIATPPLFGQSYAALPGAVYLFALLAALIPQLIGHTAFNWSAKFVNPTSISLFALFEPLVSGLIGYLLFGERPSPLTFVGAPVLLVGVAVAVWGERPARAT